MSPDGATERSSRPGVTPGQVRRPRAQEGSPIGPRFARAQSRFEPREMRGAPASPAQHASLAAGRALSGYEYSAPARRLRFAPCVAAPDFRSLFTAGTAWGTVRISAREAVVQVEAGALTLQRLEIGERVHEFTPPDVIRPGRPLTVPK